MKTISMQGSLLTTQAEIEIQLKAFRFSSTGSATSCDANRPVFGTLAAQATWCTSATLALWEETRRVRCRF